jgi:DNA-binding MarR family transcriptional regulator
MHNNDFKIEEHQRIVDSMPELSTTEIEIAEKLNVDQSSISRDVKGLKGMSQQFLLTGTNL